MPSRARLVRPDFFTDETIGKLSHSGRLMYIGTWTLADDDGYLEWNLREIALELFGYDRGRDRLTGRLADELVAAGRVQVLACGRHARVPTLERHRQKGGSLSFAVRDRHQKECVSGHSPDKSVSLPLAGAYPDPDHDSESDHEPLSTAAASPNRATATNGHSALRDDVAHLQQLAEHLTGRANAMANVYAGLGLKAVAELLDIHGLAAVEQQWRESHRRHAGRVTLRQLVFEADDALNAVARPQRRSAADLEREERQRGIDDLKQLAARKRAQRLAAEGAGSA